MHGGLPASARLTLAELLRQARAGGAQHAQHQRAAQPAWQLADHLLPFLLLLQGGTQGPRQASGAPRTRTRAASRLCSTRCSRSTCSHTDRT